MTFWDSIKQILKWFINRRVLIIVCAILIIIGPVMTATSTFNEVRQDRISFRTNPKYIYELNTFFSTQTISTPIQDYEISGYLFTPPLYYNLLAPNNKLPAIVFLHGMLVSAEIQYNIPRALAMAGFKVLSISQPGHGDSGGDWDISIQTLAGIYSAVDYLTYMCWDVDPNRIGISGHSLGGISTTRAGIFDNYTNPVTNNTIGTGGRIAATGAIYAWNDMLDTIIYAVSEMSDNIPWALTCLPDDVKDSIVFLEPSINWVLRTWTWAGNGQPITVPLNFKANSIVNYIGSNLNGTNIKNYMLISGWEDQLTHPYFQAEIMQNSTEDSTGHSAVNYVEILENCTAKLYWDYGNVTEGTARKLVLVPGTDHLREAWGKEIVYNLVSWFNQAMNTSSMTGGFGNYADYGALSIISQDYTFDFFTREVGWVLLLVGSLALIPGIVSYMSSWFKKEGDPKPKAALSFNRSQLFRKILLYSAAFIGFGVLGQALMRFVFPVASFTRFWFFDFMNLFTLFSTLFQFPAMLAIIIYEWKKQGLHSEDFGLSPKLAIRGLIIGAIAFAIPLLIYNPLAYSINQPLLLPRPFEATTYVDFFILLGVLGFQAIVIELTFRGLIQTKLDDGKRKTDRMKTLLLCGLITGLVVGLNFGLGTGIALSSIATVPLILLVIGLIGLLFGGAAILNGFIYQRTKSLTTSILITMLLLAFLEAGKLMLIYA